MKHNSLKSVSIKSDVIRGAAAVVLACVTMIAATCQAPQKADPPLATKARAEEKRTLGYFGPVTGTDYLMAPIRSRSKGEYGYESDKDAHNYVFFNTADDSTSTLLPNNDHLFVTAMSLPEKREGDKEPPAVQWFLYGLVKMDTDGDKELTYKDRRALCISDAGGGGFTEVITDVEHVYGHRLLSAETLLVIYRRNSKKYATRINLPSREAASTKELPTFGIDE